MAARKYSRQRESIKDFLATRKDHPTADMVYQNVRRQNPNISLELSGVRIHKEFNEVFVNGEEKELSNIEYQMLLLMMRHPRKIFSAQNLYESIWNEPWFYTCSSTVMVHIRKLRA